MGVRQGRSRLSPYPIHLFIEKTVTQRMKINSQGIKVNDKRIRCVRFT